MVPTLQEPQRRRLLESAEGEVKVFAAVEDDQVTQPGQGGCGWATQSGPISPEQAAALPPLPPLWLTGLTLRASRVSAPSPSAVCSKLGRGDPAFGLCDVRRRGVGECSCAGWSSHTEAKGCVLSGRRQARTPCYVPSPSHALATLPTRACPTRWPARAGCWACACWPWPPAPLRTRPSC